MIKAILTDIEGTTTALSFVKEILFPYARSRLPEFTRKHANNAEVRKILDEVSVVCGSQLDDESAILQLLLWMDEDRKTTPLKSLQGIIWETGYRDGDYSGHVYADAVHKLHEWHESGIALHVFSSGSVQAQKLLFGHTEYGDLTPLFSDYFDTNVGSKQDVNSYHKIANKIGFEAAEIIFLSDIRSELDAAHGAGMNTCLIVRDGVIEESGPHLLARNFEGIHFPD